MLDRPTLSAQTAAIPARGSGWPKWFWFALAICWFIIAPWRPLSDPDEARYAEIPREMHASGDWVTPRLNDLKYFEKPPLVYWLTAGTYAAFGVSEWTARFWAFLLTFLCLPLAYRLAQDLYGSSAGVAAATIVAANPFYAVVGHLNILDGPFSTFLVLAVCAFVWAQRAAAGSAQFAVTNATHRSAMLLVWVALALATLTKGIAAPVLAGSALFLYSLLARDWSVWRRLQLRLGIAIYLLVCAPWFVLVTMRNPEFPQFFFIHEHFARFLTDSHQRTQPFGYFVPFIVLALLPWLGCVPSALRRAWSAPALANGFHSERFMTAWCVVVFVFFSLSRSELAPYILPIMAPLAMLIAPQLQSAWRTARRAPWIAMGLITVIGAALLIYSEREFSIVRPAAIASVVVAMVTALIAAAIQSSATRSPAVQQRVASGAFAICSVLAWQALMLAYDAIPLDRQAKPLALLVKPLVTPDTELFSVGQYRHSVSPYLERTLRLVAFEGELEFGLSQDRSRYLADLPAFVAAWNRAPRAVAFVSPRLLEQLTALEFDGKRLAADRRSVVFVRP